MSPFSEDFTGTWVIKNFYFFEFELYDFYSEIFTAENIDKGEWQIAILRRIWYCKEYVYLQLSKLRRDNEEKVTLDFDMELCNSENEVLCTTEKKERVEFRSGMNYIFERVLLIDELNQKMKNGPSDILILKCRMCANRNSEIIKSTFNKSCTIINKIKFEEMLSYTRYVTYSEDPNWSNKLTLPIDESLKLVINIKTHDDYILFEIRPENGQIILIKRIKCKITLLEEDDTEKVANSDVFNFCERSQIWKFPSFLNKSLLMKRTSSLHLKFCFAVLRDKRSCVLKAHDTKHMSLPSSPNSLKNILPSPSLTDDLRKMLLNKEHADVSICVEGEEISAHKNILAARSPVFSAMFNQQMVEKKTGVIHIQDMDVQTLKLFLEFVYTGELNDLDYDRMLELFLAADKYQVPSLKEKCSRFLTQHFSPENVCDVVSVADMVSDQILKEAAIDFIKENVANVFSSPKWFLLADKNFKLCSEIICYFSETLRSK